MATTSGVKEYSIKINGLDASIKSVEKLADALKKIDKAEATAAVSVDASAKATVKKASALTAEDKAAAKLAATKERLANVDSKENRAQIEATQQLRERTREVTRQVAVNNLAEGSIRQMGMQLTDLRNEYESLTAAERANEERGGILLSQIQALDTEYKSLRESTGNFRDSVGNYEKATAGLGKLSEGLDGVTKTSMGMAQGLVGGVTAMNLFGGATAGSTATVAKLTQTIGLLSVADQVNTNVLKEGIIANKLGVVTDGIRTVQIKAKTAAEALSTKTTIAATVAQKVFNFVASLNPYVILATALVAVVGALIYFATSTEDATEKQKELNAETKNFLDYLDSEKERLSLVSNARVDAFKNQISILNAQGNKQKEIRSLEDQMDKERVAQNGRLQGMYYEELTSLEANRKKLAQYYQMLKQVQDAQARDEGKIFIDVDLNGKAEKVKVEKAVDIIQSKIDNLGRSVKIAVDLKTEAVDLKAEIETRKAARIKADQDEAKRVADENKQKAQKAKEAAEQRVTLEVEAERAAQDARLKLIESGYEKSRQTTITQYDRTIEDLKKQLAKQDNLSKAARAAINRNIKDQELLKNKDLEALDKARAEKELETDRALQDQRTSLVLGQMDRRRAEVNIKYDREVEGLKKRLKDEIDLTDDQQKAITEMIANAAILRGKELDTITVEDQTRRNALELSTVEMGLRTAQDKIGEVYKRDKSTGIIDVDATKANLAAVNASLKTYVDGMKSYLSDLSKTHEETIAGMTAGTVEYDEEQSKFAQTTLDVADKVKGAQKQMEANTKNSTELQSEYWKNLAGQIAMYAEVTKDITSSITDTLKMGLQVQIDDLTEQLDTINDKYDEAKEVQEKAVETVKGLEEQLQAATGGTADALREQLQDSMHARDEADREEQRLAKEKAKREAEIAKKEKQMKKADLLSNIATSIANTAQAVTKALTLVFPLNLVVAGLVGAMGGIQVGIMAKQLAKLAKGGEINGPSHADGGVKIPSMGVEVEGGEYVVNKQSYSANEGLVKFINASPDTLSITDIAGVLPGLANLPVSVADTGRSTDDRIIDAISQIEFKPVVAVTDIIDKTEEVTTVRDLAGF